MAKGAAVQAGSAEVSSGYDHLTPECHACGEEHVGMGTPICLMIPGMLFPSTEYAVPIFVPDPDAKIRVVQMPNGQIAFVTDETVVKHAHESCVEQLINDVAYGVSPGDDDDDDEDLDDDSPEEALGR